MVPELKIFPNFKLVYAYFLLLHLDNYTLKLINPDGHNWKLLYWLCTIHAPKYRQIESDVPKVPLEWSKLIFALKHLGHTCEKRAPCKNLTIFQYQQLWECYRKIQFQLWIHKINLLIYYINVKRWSFVEYFLLPLKFTKTHVLAWCPFLASMP
jgi:hypothetical protein